MIRTVVPLQRVVAADVRLAAMPFHSRGASHRYVVGVSTGRSGIASGVGAAGSLAVVLLGVACGTNPAGRRKVDRRLRQQLRIPVASAAG